MTDILTRIERKGTITKIGPGQVDPEALANHLLALRVQGHAVAADEVFTSDGVSLGISVTHYLSCKLCEQKTSS